MQRAAITRVQDAVTTYWKKQDNDIHNTVDRVVGECRGQSLEMGSELEAKMVRKRGKKGREEEGKREKKTHISSPYLITNINLFHQVTLSETVQRNSANIVQTKAEVSVTNINE